MKAEEVWHFTQILNGDEVAVCRPKTLLVTVLPPLAKLAFQAPDNSVAEWQVWRPDSQKLGRRHCVALPYRSAARICLRISAMIARLVSNLLS
jgi:hypothetical protein